MPTKTELSPEQRTRLEVLIRGVVETKRGLPIKTLQEEFGMDFSDVKAVMRHYVNQGMIHYE